MMVRLEGIEPSTPAWKAEVLPLNYSRENTQLLTRPQRVKLSLAPIAPERIEFFLQNVAGKGVAGVF